MDDKAVCCGLVLTFDVVEAFVALEAAASL